MRCPLLTLSVISPASIAALRKVHSITSSAMERTLGVTQRGRGDKPSGGGIPRIMAPRYSARIVHALRRF
jgi:hypothetical protein